MKSCPKCGGESGYTRAVKYIGKELQYWNREHEDTEMDVAWYSEIVRCRDCGKGTKYSRDEEVQPDLGERDE